MNPEQQQQFNERTRAVFEKIGQPAEPFKTLDQSKLLAASQEAVDRFFLTPEQMAIIEHKCRAAVAGIIIDIAEDRLELENAKGLEGKRFYNTMNSAFQFGPSEKALKKAVLGVGTSVAIIEERFNLVFPPGLTKPIANFAVALMSSYSAIQAYGARGQGLLSLAPTAWHAFHALWATKELFAQYNIQGFKASSKTVRQPQAPRTQTNVPPTFKMKLAGMLKVNMSIKASYEEANKVYKAALEAAETAKEINIDADISIKASTEAAYATALQAAEAAKKGVDHFSDVLKKMSEEISKLKADDAIKVAQNAARKIKDAEEDEARRIADEAIRKATHNSRTGVPEKYKGSKKEFGQVMTLFRQGERPSSIKRLLHTLNPQKSMETRLRSEYDELWRDGGEFFPSLTVDEYEEERKLKFTVKTWIIMKKKLADTNSWLDRRRKRQKNKVLHGCLLPLILLKVFLLLTGAQMHLVLIVSTNYISILRQCFYIV